jgi:hypothetical protein
MRTPALRTRPCARTAVPLPCASSTLQALTMRQHGHRVCQAGPDRLLLGAATGAMP